MVICFILVYPCSGNRVICCLYSLYTHLGFIVIFGKKLVGYSFVVVRMENIFKSSFVANRVDMVNEKGNECFSDIAHCVTLERPVQSTTVCCEKTRLMVILFAFGIRLKITKFSSKSVTLILIEYIQVHLQ